MNNRIGQQLGNYRLTHLLGLGGFAEVYLAEHIHLKTPVAIKLLYGKLTAQDIQAFQNEAQTIATLKHPHILRVLDFGFEQTLPFFVMDYASGGTLRDLYPGDSPVPLPIVLSLVKPVSSALAYAHSRKLIHRDVKPENMLIDADKNILLSDFGIVAVAHSTASMKTIDNTGTVHYMAPEQIKGKPRPASDQYALATVVYEWLCGERPFMGDTAIEIAMKQLSDDPPSLCQRVPSLSPAVEQVIFKALEKDPQQRFPDIEAFSSALDLASQAKQNNRYSGAGRSARQAPPTSSARQSIPPTTPAHGMTPPQPSQRSSKDLSDCREVFRQRVEKESQSSIRGRVLGTIIACISQGQGQRTVVNLIQESYWINGMLSIADVKYAKDYTVDNYAVSAAIFREVLPGDYMIWVNPDHPVSAYISQGQTIVVVL